MRRIVLTLVIWIVSPGICHAGGDGLVPDPSMLARIAALSPNHAVRLGEARVVGEFNEVAKRFGLHRTGPQARDFSLKMVWSPERGRALFAGANHGRPHRLNDVWEFDLAGMAWILLYPPDNPRSAGGLGRDFSDVLFDGGVLITRRGGPAIIGHTWSGLTYDPVRRRMLFMNTWLSNKDDAIRLVDGNPAERYTGPPLWAFSPETRAWSLLKTEPPAPFVPAAAMLEYVPELDGAIWHMNNWRMRSTWLYEATANRWLKLTGSAESKSFEAQAPSAELVGYHDPKRKLLISRQGRATFHFDTRKRVWEKVHETPTGQASVPNGHDAKNAFYYDPVSQRGMLVDFASRTLWSYDPDLIQWERVRPDGDPMPSGKRMLAFFDQALNVLVVVDDLEVWIYRPK